MNTNRILLALLTCIFAVSCASSKQSSSQSPSVAGEPAKPETPAASIESMDITILVTDCGSVSGYSAAVAEKTMRRLVEGCSSVPGGKAEFVATLQPGGRIALAPSEGADETVPICVLKHQLTHQVQIRRACKLHVQMEQKTPTPLGSAGAANVQN